MPAPKQDNSDDLDSEHPEVGQPLQQTMRLVKVVFFATIIVCALINTVFLLRYRAADSARSEWRAKEAQYLRELEVSKGKVDDIKLETVKAQEATKWVEGTRSIQEVVLAVTRSMDVATAATLANLSITRLEEDPAKLAFAVKIDGSGKDITIQLNAILRSLSEISYSPYAARERRGKKYKGILYEATLIRIQNR